MDKYVKRYGDYLVNWFNEDYSSTIRRMEIVNKVNNGYGNEIALSFVNENAESLMNEIESDCFNSFTERAELFLLMKDHLAQNKYFREVARYPQKYTKILYHMFFADLVDFLNNHLIHEFEVED